MDCPERFPAERAGEEVAAEWTSCGVGSGGRGCAREPRPETWPGTRRRLPEVECVFLCGEVVAAAEEPGRWERGEMAAMAQADEASGSWRRKVAPR